MMDEDAVLEEYIHPMEPIPTDETPTGLSKISRVKSILFDVYGTLLISRSGDKVSPVVSHNQKRVLAGVMRRYGIARPPENLMDSLRRAIENEHASLRQGGNNHPEVDIVRIWQRLLCTDDSDWVESFALEYEMVLNPVYPMPGLEELLSVCRGQNRLLGIISNAQFYTPRLLELVLGKPLDTSGFDPQLTFYSYRFGSAKPSCLMFELAAEIFAHRGIPLSSVLYVGNDMHNDILPAKTVGFQTALFAGDQRSLRKRSDDVCCRHIVPDMIITDLRQLIVDTENL
jgi:putative hydrolase of the HAD superfamily